MLSCAIVNIHKARSSSSTLLFGSVTRPARVDLADFPGGNSGERFVSHRRGPATLYRETRLIDFESQRISPKNQKGYFLPFNTGMSLNIFLNKSSGTRLLRRTVRWIQGLFVPIGAYFSTSAFIYIYIRLYKYYVFPEIMFPFAFVINHDIAS